jgi:hypothetical protein
MAQLTEDPLPDQVGRVPLDTNAPVAQLLHRRRCLGRTTAGGGFGPLKKDFLRAAAAVVAVISR